MDIGEEMRVIEVEPEKEFMEPLFFEEMEDGWPEKSPIRDVRNVEPGDS